MSQSTSIEYLILDSNIVVMETELYIITTNKQTRYRCDLFSLLQYCLQIFTRNSQV